jgi:crotonobetainyl-CoA:carnitine CoA-transferase CaiB-like acyl-CoA transferase
MNASHADTQRLPRPLEGIRIVDCGIWHAGPGAAAILGDLGAEVIKVETLSGDVERFFGNVGTMASGTKTKPNWNLLFEMSNRNKKGICVDTSTPDGKKILNSLVEGADIFVTNLRQSTKTKLGLDYQSLSKINPKIIHANINGYGPRGDMKDVGGFDPLGQAISGMMFVTGADEPVFLQSIILDQLTAITASHAMLTALFVRERHGIGQEICISLYGSAIWLMHANILCTSVLGGDIQLKWDRMKNPYQRNSYKCGDGKWMMVSNTPEFKYWPVLCEAIGHRELEHDPRFQTPELRETNNVELIGLLDAVFLGKTRLEWLAIFRPAGLLFLPVQKLTEVIEDPQTLANGYMFDFNHPSLGTIRIPGYPISFSANTAGTHAPAPDLGEHTASVLTNLGYSNDEIERLAAAKIVR